MYIPIKSHVIVKSVHENQFITFCYLLHKQLHTFTHKKFWCMQTCMHMHIYSSWQCEAISYSHKMGEVIIANYLSV